MDKLKMHTPDFTQQNIAKLAELFPNCVTEARDDESGEVKKAIDFDQLRQELSDHVVDGPRERYHLNWPGKKEALLAANAPIAKTLRPCREESVDFDTTKNLFIEGDNLDALKLLQETLLGKVTVVYCDPPYNTGREFIYDDDFCEDSGSYFLRSLQIDDDGQRLVANTDANGRRHSDWLSMIYSRIKLARNLLRDDGCLFISIGDDENKSLQMICNEVFGEDNFVSCVTRIAKTSSNTGTHFASSKDYVLCYARNIDLLPRFSVPLTPDQVATYNKSDEKGRYKEIGLFQAALKHGGASYAISCPDGTSAEPPNGQPFRWREKTFLEGKAAGLIVFKQTTRSPLLIPGTGKRSEWNIYTKLYLHDRQDAGLLPRDFVDGFHNSVATRELRDIGIPFDFPKPTSLISFLVNLHEDKTAMVVDLFAGSGTTAHACMQLNSKDQGARRSISIQLQESLDPDDRDQADGAKFCDALDVPRQLTEVAKERIRRAGKTVKEEAGLNGEKLDIGFRVLKVDSSNMKDVYYTPGEVDQQTLAGQVDNIKDDRSDEDLLFQVLLDWGVDLTLPIAPETIQGKRVYFVDANALAACFESGIDEDFIKELAKRKPLRAVFRDSGYGTDTAKINVEQIFKLISPTTEVKSI